MLRTRALSITLAVLLCGFAGCSGCGSHAEDIKQATAAVDTWVKLIDQGDYGKAYDETGAQFKKMTGKDAWVKQITPYRGALGQVASRTVESAEYSESIPDLQPGQYVLLKYKTAFKSMPNSHEEITAQKETDGVWRSLGYYVHFTN
jgi:hypothetical protein